MYSCTLPLTSALDGRGGCSTLRPQPSTMESPHCLWDMKFNPLNAELNPIRHLLALAGARHFVHVSRMRVNKAGSVRIT